MSARKILKVIDKSDSYYTPMNGIPDLPVRMAVIGKSQLSGKSTIILNLLLRPEFYGGMFEPEDVYLVSNNKLDQKLRILAEQMEVPGSNIMRYSEDRLQSVYDHIEEMAAEAMEEGQKPVRSLVLIDDCSFSGDLKCNVNGVMSQLYCNGRHASISTIVTAQKYSQLSTVIRTNVTAAVLFGNSMKELDLITEDMNFLRTKKEFVKIFREATREPNSFMVVDYTSPGYYYDSTFSPIHTSL